MKICPAGHSCFNGTIDMPKQCIFSVACSSEGTVRHNPGVVFIILFVIFWGGLYLFKYLMSLHMKMLEDLVDKTVEEEHQIKKHSKIDDLAKARREQDAYMNRLMFITNTRFDIKSMRKSMSVSSITIDIDSDNDNSDKDKDKAVGHTLGDRTIAKKSLHAKRWVGLIKSNKFKQYAQMVKTSRDIASSCSQSDRSFAFQVVTEPLCISFDSLNLNLKKNGAPILQEIFGTIKPFSVTALMGASGAGKTTLLSLLRGQANFATTSGKIYVNGREVESLIPHRNQMAFVPQDDIVYDNLTVEENIVYSAILFNKRGFTTRQQVLPMVVYIMDLLGITFIRHSIVGSPDEKGISGGQKKRTSVAMELTKEAKFFLLDEPTSGMFSYFI
jgi:ABC-type multidrug transport system fused ATPase/permease subunit